MVFRAPAAEIHPEALTRRWSRLGHCDWPGGGGRQLLTNESRALTWNRLQVTEGERLHLAAQHLCHMK